MVQQGQVFQLTRCGPGGERLWAHRYRTGGRESERVQRGGFASEQDARDALERELASLVLANPRCGPCRDRRPALLSMRYVCNR